MEPRTSGERAGDNFQQGVFTGVIPTAVMARMRNPVLGLTPERIPTTLPEVGWDILQSSVGKVLDQAQITAPIMAAARLYGAAQPARSREMLAAERTRRANYEAASQSDPWYNAPGGIDGQIDAGIATAMGAVAGFASDPTTWGGPGGAVRGIAPRVGRAAAWGGVLGAQDVVRQAEAGQAGFQDAYRPEQTAGAVAAGVGFNAASQALGPLASRLLNPKAPIRTWADAPNSRQGRLPDFSDRAENWRPNDRPPAAPPEPVVTPPAGPNPEPAAPPVGRPPSPPASEPIIMPPPPGRQPSPPTSEPIITPPRGPWPNPEPVSTPFGPPVVPGGYGGPGLGDVNDGPYGRSGQLPPSGVVGGEPMQGVNPNAAPPAPMVSRARNGRLVVPEDPTVDPVRLAQHGDTTPVVRRSEFLSYALPDVAPHVGRTRGYVAEQLRYRDGKVVERLRLYENGDWLNIRNGEDLGTGKLFATEAEAQAAADTRGLQVADMQSYSKSRAPGSNPATPSAEVPNIQEPPAAPRAPRAPRQPAAPPVAAPRQEFGEAADVAPRTDTGPRGTGPRPGEREVVRTPQGGSNIDTAFEVVELDSLTVSHGLDLAENPAFPQDLQPRDRTTPASEKQIAKFVAELDPPQLGHDVRGDGGSPIVGPEGVVESGNGRAIGFGRSYQKGTPGIAAYREWLQENGWNIDGMREPVLVRRRITPLTPEERRAFTSVLNDRPTAAMGTREQAKADAGKLTLDVLDQYAGGHLSSPENGKFVRSAVNQVISSNDLGGLLDGAGRLTSAGESRLRAGMLHRAYESPELVSKMFDDTRQDLGNVGRALTEAAPRWAQMREAEKTGKAAAGFDATKELLEAVAMIRAAKEKRTHLASQFETTDMMGRDPRVEQFVKLLHTDKSLTRLRSQAAMRASLEAFAEAGRATETGSMFGESGEKQSREALDGLVRRAHSDAERALEDPTNEPDLFARGPRRKGTAVPPTRATREAPRKGEPKEAGPKRKGETLNAPQRSKPLRNAPTLEGVPKPAGSAPAKVTTIAEMRQKFVDALKATARQGRLSARGALGTFSPKSGVVRTLAVGEMDVLAHELGHHLDYMALPSLTAAQQTHKALVRSMAYPGAAQAAILKEGLAEFGRWYITNPDHVKKIALPFYKAFEAALKTDAPEIAAALKEIQELYTALKAAPSTDVATSSIIWPEEAGELTQFSTDAKRNGIGGAIRAWADRIYEGRVDRLHPINVAVRELVAIAKKNGKNIKLTTAANPYRLARMATDALSSGVMDVQHGVRPYHGVDPEGPSLGGAVAKAMGKKWKEETVQEFGAYLASRRMIQEWDRYNAGQIPNPADKFEQSWHVQVKADFEAAHPSFSAAADMVYEWNRNLWRKQFEAGLLTPKAYAAGLKMEDYVPIQRDMSDKGDLSPRRFGKSLQYAGGAKRFGGSTRDVINPIHSMIVRAQRVAALVARNEIFLALDDLGQRAGLGAGAIVERLPAKQKTAIQVNALDVVEKALKESGLDRQAASDLMNDLEDALDGDDMVTMFPSGEMKPNGEPVIFAWKAGEKMPLRLPDGDFGKRLFDVLAGLTQEVRDTVLDVLAVGSQALRTGIVMSPDYQVRNLIRDQVSAAILTNVPFIPFWHTAGGMVDVLGSTKRALRYYNFGGLRGGENTASLAKSQVTAEIRRFADRGHRISKIATWRGLVEASELGERSTRLAVFRLAEAKAKKAGLGDYEAAKDASYEARDYFDPERAGSKMETWRRLFVFMNSGIQGVDKLRRVLAREGAERHGLNGVRAHAVKGHVLLVALGALGAMQAMSYRDDPEYQEINEYLRATHWAVKFNGEWVFIPKPFELAVYSNVMERALERDSKKFERMARGVGQIFIPPHSIPGLSVAMELGANRDSQGRPIVPDHLLGKVDPAQQFGPNTSRVAKDLGRILKVSPSQIDHVVGGFFGTLGRYGLKTSDRALDAVLGGGKPRMAATLSDAPVTGSFVRDPARGSRSQAEFWRLLGQRDGELTMRLGTFKRLAGEGDPAKAVEYLAGLSPQERQWVVTQYVGGIVGKVHPLARAQQAGSVISDLRRDITAGNITELAGKRITLTPESRRAVDTALSHLAMANTRNAMIASRQPGFEGMRPIPQSEAMAELTRASPETARLLRARLALKKVPDEALSNRAWELLTPAINAVQGEAMGRLIERDRLKSPDKARAIEEVVRQQTTVTPTSTIDRVERIVKTISPGITITSGYRTPARNREVDGAVNSYHIRGEGRAFDIRPAPGQTMSQLYRQLKDSGLRWREIINEGDHVHVAW